MSAPGAAASGLLNGGRRRASRFAPRLLLGAVLVAVAAASGPAPPPLEPAAPTTPREFFNAGTEKLHENKLREAETFLESALTSQYEPVQPPALYNLGHVRFDQGREELKKAPPGLPTVAAGQAVSQRTDDTIRFATEALASDDVRNMVAAYLRGRGQRKELRAALGVVRRTLQVHTATLNKWQRAAGDFRSALELNRADEDARYNAEVVDRWIARLVDTLRQLQQLASAMGNQRRDLNDKMKQLRGRIPTKEAPPGTPVDEDEDDEQDQQPMGPQEGQQEAVSREGEEMPLSPEQAAWLLEGFKLDVERRLPMGPQRQAEPKDRNRPTW